MDIASFFKGLVVGFLVATPVGPIAMLCIHRTLNQGKFQGVISGLGAATADAVYGFIAAFGLTFITEFLVKEQKWLRLAGGILLCYMGVRIFLSKSARQAVSANSSAFVGNYASAFLVTLTNPLTLVAFAAVFAGFGLVSSTGHYASAGLLVAGVFVGSTLWWLVLTAIGGTVLEKLGQNKLVWLNRIAGLIIVAFGLLILLSLEL